MISSLSEQDLFHHVLTVGIDVFPAIEIPNERTRLNMLYEEAHSRWETIYEQLLSSDTEFRISRRFRTHNRPVAEVASFTLTSRGPVWNWPLLLPPPVNTVKYDFDLYNHVKEAVRLFFAMIPERKKMRFGVVRDLLFRTGQEPCQEILTRRSKLSGAELIGGQATYVYRDQKYNTRVIVEPVEIIQQAQLPTCAAVSADQAYALQVKLDVNNHEMRPLSEDDASEVLERANSLWPDELLDYLNEGSQP